MVREMGRYMLYVEASAMCWQKDTGWPLMSCLLWVKIVKKVKRRDGSWRFVLDNVLLVFAFHTSLFCLFSADAWHCVGKIGRPRTLSGQNYRTADGLKSKYQTHYADSCCFPCRFFSCFSSQPTTSPWSSTTFWWPSTLAKSHSIARFSQWKLFITSAFHV